MTDAPGVSKVAEMRARLIELIDHGEEGAALPGERRLAQEWRVARMTVRRALDDLVAAGLVAREHGRGNFITRPKLRWRLAMTSFSRQMRSRGMVPGSETLEFRRLSAGRQQARALRVPVDTPIISFTRLRTADGEPVGLETTRVPADLAPGLGPIDLDGSWYDLLAERYGITIMAGQSTIEPTMLSADEAARLRTEPGSPAFHLDGVSFSTTGRVVSCGTGVFRGDRFQLTTDLHPVPPDLLQDRLMPVTTRRGMEHA